MTSLPATRDEKLDNAIQQYRPTGRPGELVLEDAHILGGQFKNFAGEERAFNAAGNRNFHVRIEEQLAQALIQDGWNVKWKEPRSDEEDGFYHLKVTVGFKSKRPPLLVMITSRGRVDLGQHECEILDWVDIEKVDMIINPYSWQIEATGKSGVKAYLKSIFVTIREDYLDQKYADVPYAQGGAAGLGGPLELEGPIDPSELDQDDVIDAEVVYDSDEEA